MILAIIVILAVLWMLGPKLSFLIVKYTAALAAAGYYLYLVDLFRG